MEKRKKKKSSKIPIPILVIIYSVLLYATYQSVSSIVLALFGQTTTGYVDYYSNTIQDRSADAGRSRSIIKDYYFYVGDKTYRGRVSYSSDEAWPSLKEGETRPERIRYLGFFPYINSTVSLADFDSMSGGQIFATFFVPFGCFGLFMLLHTSNKRAKKKDREAAERAAKREARKAINTDKNDRRTTMNTFHTMEDAVEFAATLCNSWTDAFSADNKYNADDMAGMAGIEDDEHPLDEDGFFAVSPAGAIGLCDDGEDINWLFISGAAPNEDLPSKFSSAAKFCPKCGKPVVSGARFCGSCGERIG